MNIYILPSSFFIISRERDELDISKNIYVFKIRGNVPKWDTSELIILIINFIDFWLSFNIIFDIFLIIVRYILTFIKKIIDVDSVSRCKEVNFYSKIVKIIYLESLFSFAFHFHKIYIIFILILLHMKSKANKIDCYSFNLKLFNLNISS